MLEALTKLLGVLTWPIVVLIVVVLLRREIRGLFGRVRAIEGPGDLKVSLDPNKVGQILDEGRKENASTAAVAERIVQSATILDPREARILRALVDDDGRALYSYQSDYYRPALDALITKGYVRRQGKGFALTDEGQRIVRDYLLGVIHNPIRAAAKA
jgi:hypothetical protein